MSNPSIYQTIALQQSSESIACQSGITSYVTKEEREKKPTGLNLNLSTIDIVDSVQQT